MPDLSPVLARFVETMNARGSDGFVACFAGGAKVRDEGLLRGAAEIRARIEGAFASDRPLLEETDVAATDSVTVISGPGSGTLPGGPVVLHYHPTLADGLIMTLGCAA